MTNDQPPPPSRFVVLKQITATIDSTGRPFAAAVPPDLTDEEILEIVGWMSNRDGLRSTLERARAPIIVPRLT
jgi:hypothetical protein